MKRSSTAAGGGESKVRKKASVWERRWDGAIRKAGRRKAMRAGIWSKTPHDIQIHLLHFLPLTSLCRFRCVSKWWRSAIASSSSSSSSSKPWFISFSGGVRICNGSAWRRFEFPLSPGSSGRHDVNYVSTSAGLVLGTYSETASTCWLGVYNPFVPGSGRALEPLVDSVPIMRQVYSRVIFTGIQALEVSGGGKKMSFAVAALTCGYAGVLLHVFDSRSWSWVVRSAPLPVGSGNRVYQGRRNHNSFLLHDERLYFLTVSTSNIRSLKSVSIWDPENTSKTLATWTDLPLNLHQNSYADHWEYNHPSLIVCQGKLVFVNVIHHLAEPCAAIGFVYLDEVSGSWQELLSYPMSGFPEQVRQKSMREYHRGIVWASGSPESSKVALFFLSSWGCVFDVTDSSWRRAFPSDAEAIMPFHPSFLTF